MTIVRGPSAREKRDQHALALYKAGLPVHEIAAAAHLSRRGVYDILTKYGVAKNRPSGRSPDLIRSLEMLELRARGMSCKQIAQLYDVTPGYISEATRTRDPSLTVSARRQQRIEKAAELRRQGLTAKAIAEELGVTIGAVFIYLRQR